MIVIDGLRLEFAEAIDRKQIGEVVTVEFYRDGTRHTADKAVAVNAPLLTWNRQYDNEPKYRIYGGLTFVAVSRNFLESWGRTWPAEIPFTLRYLFMHANHLIDDPEIKEFVVLSEILPDEVNAYLSGFKHQVIETINDIKINALDDLEAAFAVDLDGHWIVRFMNNDSPMILNAEVARARLPYILRKYDVPAASN
jgi:hypothetical protein